MNKNIKYLLITAGCLLTAGLSAQTLRSAYFLDRMPMRHHFNPALINDQAYVSFPVLGNIGIGTHATFGLNSFIYNRGGQAVTFMHESVGVDEFLDGLKKKNALEVDVDVTIFSMGIFAFGGYNTLEIGVRSNTGVYLPKSLFEFMKKGMYADQVSYQIEGLRVKSNNYVELAFGHARPVLDKLDAGAKVKLLFGGANVNARMEQMNVSMSQDQWIIDAQGEINGSMRGAKFKFNGDRQIDGLKVNSPGLGGFGLGFDFGATYRLLENLNLSLALTDLGFITWNQNLKAATNNEPYIFDGFKNEISSTDADDDSGNSFGDQLDDLGDDLKDLFQFYQVKAPSRRTTALRATLNAGAEYSILDEKISFGALWSTRFGRPKAWTELMLSSNFRPSRWFNAAITGSASNYGFSWGWVLNFCPKGFNFFIGSDHMLTRFSPQGVPVRRANFNVNLGINFPFGRNNLKETAVNKAERIDRAFSRPEEIDPVEAVKEPSPVGTETDEAAPIDGSELNK